MPTPQQQPDPNALAKAVQGIRGLARSATSPTEFWPASLSIMSEAVSAEMAALLVQAVNTGSDTRTWRVPVMWPDDVREAPGFQPFLGMVTEMAEAALADGHVVRPLVGKGAPEERYAVGICLKGLQERDAGVAAFTVAAKDEAEARACVDRLQLLVDAPTTYQLASLLRQSRDELQHFQSIVDLMVMLNEQKRFVAAGMMLCNEIAGRLGCGRVSLGWVEKGYVRLKAVSHTERFERKMLAAQVIEAAMEETVDQDDEIVWPAPEEASSICRDHEQLAREQDAAFICSVPLRMDQKTVAALTCERSTEAFSEQDVLFLRLCADQAVRRLGDLKRRDRWFGARLCAAIGEKTGGVIGTEHTGMKLLAVLCAVLIAVLVFGEAEYRVEAPFVLRSERVVHVPAPFDGYIESVAARTGDVVNAGDSLLQLDTKELLLEKAAVEAERNQYLRSLEKARAANSLASMRVAQAQADQATARLDLVEHRLALARVGAPADGVVVRGAAPGELSERVGAPVNRGDVLLKVAVLDGLYAEVSIAEESVGDVAPGASGQIAFASRPALAFPVTLARIEPVARPSEKGSQFLADVTLDEAAEDWFRPGLTGICKVNAGRRTFLWIFTHRTVDFLRMWFWW